VRARRHWIPACAGGQALAMLGRKDEALAALKQAVRLSNDGAVFVAERAHAARGERGEAERRLQRIQSGRYVPSLEIARVYLALGQDSMAMARLVRAYEQRSHSMAFLRVDPQLAPLREDPKFRELLQRVGL
jgi:tetratricopeptide (TPR) repeat protein